MNDPNLHQTTESEFEGIVSIAPFPILVHKMGVIVYANPLCLELFATDDINEIIGVNILDFTVPEDRPAVIEAIKRGYREKIRHSVVAARILNKKGQIVYTETKSSSIHFRGEECRLLVAYNYDLAAKVKEELEDKNLLLSKIAQMLPDSLIVVDNLTRNVLFENRPLYEVLGYTPQDFKDGDQFDLFTRIIHKEDIHKLVEARKFLFDPHNYGRYITTEYRVLDKQGKWRWILSRSTVFKKLEGEKHQYNFGIAQDITSLKETENELKESKNLLQKIAEVNPNHISIFDFETNEFVFYNFPLGRKLGYTKGEEPKDILDYFHPSYKDEARKNIKKIRALKQGEIFSSTGKYIGREGKVRYLLTRSTPFLIGADGLVKQSFNTIVDVTELKELEEQLIKSKALSDKIITTTPNHIAIYNLQNGETTYTNYDFSELFGYSKEDAVTDIMQLYHEEYQSVISENLRKIAALKEGEVFTTVDRGRHKNGKDIYLLSRVTPFSIDESGHVVQILANTIDITEMREAELKLQTSEQNRKAILMALPDMIFNISIDGIILDFYVNNNFAADIDTNTYLGAHIKQLVPVNICDDLMHLIVKAIETGDIQTYEYEYNVANRELFFEIRIRKMNEREVIMLTRDISDLKATRKQLQERIQELSEKNIELEKYITSNTELEKFAYITSHDLREPVRSIVGFAQLLQKRNMDKLDNESQEFVKNIIDSAQRMNTLIHGLLDYSRITAQGKAFVPCDLNVLLRKVVSDLSISIEESGTELVIANLPVVNADELQIRQLFQNLISNSIKFRKSSQRSVIYIKAERQEGRWLFMVQDNGIGLDMKYCDKVFQIFSRLHTSDKYEGTGIGLALCKRIVERHGGEIWLQSEVGEGTTFYFTLPLH